MDYPIWLALEDFVPVLLGIAGFALLSRTAPPPARTAGFIGAMLIGLGGLSKCAWKLTVASGGGNPRLLEEALFPLMAAGATILVWALAVAVRRGKRVHVWPFGLTFAVVAVASVVTRSLHPMFILATFGVTAVSVLGAILAARHRQWWAVSLFILGLVLVTSLVPLRGSAQHETVAYQWLEQSLNTSAQLALLIAAWLTFRAVLSAPAPPRKVGEPV
ncbi:hypothetical protein ACQPZX_19575 [Actinoplanes sp. CA-142083]|uniref:hypothetical protein n=1 Tax=Actinoplanes sp. CA-142083 TaxID=3239903 RepID=UPI003D94DC5E